MAGGSRSHILNEVNDSLRRLQTDYIDVFQMHRPNTVEPIDETMRTLDDLVRAGKIRYLGCSNYSGWQLAEAMSAAKEQHYARYVSVQPQYNILSRDIERELMPACQYYGVGIIPYLPLAGGFLTGKYRRGQERPADARGGKRPGPFFDRWLSDHNYDVVEGLEGFAGERGHPVSELAVAWLLARPMVSTVICGVSRVAQVEANAKAAEWKLTPDEVKQVEELSA